ncbi:hypothetical protein [Brucella intermedia]|uniref:Signal recognition particle n=1 Tax=Brucella intermedia M86 TaxID=1234597 RepID=M5K282_9HYPH|nr:hypothetical protein [Brucella intermedia]ELT50989.1 hypothetical protein D584_01308 [Brucella intermedia M86]
MKGILTAIAVFGFCTAAQASDVKSSQLANRLGSVLASEEACGLTYDQGAIEKFISANVAADDMSFPSMLDVMTNGNRVSLERMSPSQKTAHCTQVRRVAKSYKFVN